MGGEVFFGPGDFGDDPIRVDTPVIGKLQWVPAKTDD